MKADLVLAVNRFLQYLPQALYLVVSQHGHRLIINVSLFESRDIGVSLARLIVFLEQIDYLLVGGDVQVWTPTVELDGEGDRLLDPDGHFVGYEVAHGLVFIVRLLGLHFVLLFGFFEHAQERLEVVIVVVILVPSDVVLWRRRAPALEDSLAPQVELGEFLDLCVGAPVSVNEPIDGLLLYHHGSSHGEEREVKLVLDDLAMILPEATEEDPEVDHVNFCNELLVSRWIVRHQSHSILLQNRGRKAEAGDHKHDIELELPDVVSQLQELKERSDLVVLGDHARHF